MNPATGSLATVGLRGATVTGFGTHRRRVLLVAAAWILWMTACAPAAGPDEPDGARYLVTGIVRGIEQSDGVTRLSLEHDEIPDFVDIDGNIVGMDAMTMTMTVWSGLSLPTGLEIGDPVRFGLDVDWRRAPAALIVDLEVVGSPESGDEGADGG